MSKDQKANQQTEEAPPAATIIDDGAQPALPRVTVNRFQSREAERAATTPSKLTELPVTVLRQGTDADDLVRVRAREQIPPFRYGSDADGRPKMYQVPKGQDVFIPRKVRDHLAEKNLL